MLEIKEIFTDEEFNLLKEEANEVYENQLETRKENEEAYLKVKKITSGILNSFAIADLHGKVVKKLIICKTNINDIAVEMKTASKVQKEAPQYPHFTEELTNTVCSLMSEYWDEGVWIAVMEVFRCFPHYSARYSSMPDKKTLTVIVND